MILSILGMGLSGLVFEEIRFARTYQRLNFSLPLAKAALKTVFYLRQNDPTPQYDTWGELAKENTMNLCANNSFKYYFADKNKKLKVDGQAKEAIIDEGALININTASIDVLKKLPGLDEDLADKIVNAGLRPFSSINEVLLIEGMKKDNFLAFKDMVTVYGAGKININTASCGVLLALGLDEELIKQILRFRKEHEIVAPADSPAAETEYGFSSVGSIVDDLRSFTFLSLRQEQDLMALLPTLDVKSEYLRFNVIAYAGAKEGVHYSIVIHPAAKKIVSWREN